MVRTVQRAANSTEFERPRAPAAGVALETSTRRPIDSLTGLRFFAALIVVISHFPEIIPIDGAAGPLDSQGAAGVTIFFVLSGFVLTYNYFDRFHATTKGMRSFMRARAARIYPMYVVALLIITPLVLLITNDSPSLGSWFVNLGMGQSLIPAAGMHLWNIPSWSVSTEVIFYCLFPFFICWVLARVRPRRLLALGGILFAIQVALFCVVAVLAEQRLERAGKSAEDITLMLKRTTIFPGLRVWEFFLGCVIGLAYIRSQAGGDQGRWLRVLSARRVRNILVVLVALGLLGILLLPSIVELPTRGLVAHLTTAGLYLAYTPLAIVLVAALAWGPTTVSPFLEHRWAQVLGDASYSFYLLQWSLIILVADSAWAPSPRTWWFSGAAILVLIVASVLSARWIERPARQMIRGSRREQQNPFDHTVDVGGREVGVDR